ncbi:O-acetylhomoserine aminocarboxypropyltransferase/cysteine synthase [Porcipelethomonas ammoniilytica]|uniref:O-acetylhomoserine aminocarboxypropyltransferase/cysteine synthase family protein n=3 Tax=Porcipelethomonas TaxID=2981643 RepID=UPI0008205F3A|nr:O-acetylhomoserine aminocarboxypropyltransferase/cysteine synthase family protein [Porcipelethomonas ammoniilytica]MBS6314277.1 O-acetylhomoserine aminocarboxypropyltransferase/cysteine synthase [Ruminococcus sp.]MEE0185764.1 O-acetylhomoserine aminocarboxypropyltransferase/cysteine synthase family protein [Oscillospiraceae bacterium]OLA68206.1 MAG: O-acetylhomoserine aminocarboxypropyltransferase [Ruminococcus sp. 37_24]SCI80462.1 Methionine gamma-lyase [uncultured Ruminococcus sp.]MCU6719
MKIETKCLHEGYHPKNTEPRVIPIVQSTTYVYDSTDDVAAVFDDPTKSLIYSRFENPTVMAVEEKIAALEGGAAAMATSSGQAATLCSLLNICSAGDSFISTGTIYGGTVNLFAVTLKKLGIECIFVDADASEEELQKAFKPNTKAVFGETLANPALSVLDIEKFAKLAHKNNVPLIIDNTFPTPILCRPIEHGADIVVHSTSKYMDGHAVQVGGVIIDSGNFDWTNGKFPEFTEPDESYHGIVYTQSYGKLAYIVKARMQLMRDFGCYPAANSAFLLNLGLETLAVRMKQYCENAKIVADYLEASDKVLSVNYPGLKSNKYYELAQKYLPDGCSGVITFSIKGGRDNAVKFMDSLKLASNVVHVADIRTCVLHPASATHRQLTDEQLAAAGIDGGMIRFSCGLENIDDIIEDIAQALEKI